jgi:GTP-binding protein LepA
MVFASVFPVDASDYDALAAALGRLTLADASVAVAKTASSALGAGFRLGFLGALHGEVFLQRLADDERGVEVLSTPPTVPYRVLPRGVCAASTPRSALPPPLTSAADFPKALPRGTTVLEPVVTASILVPAARVGAAMDLAAAARGVLVDHASLGGATARLTYTLPLAELGAGFATRLLSATSGTASLDYEDEGGEAPADVVRLDLALNCAPVDALARVVPRSAAAAEGRALVAAAAAVVGAQLFEVAVQAVADGRPVARATVKARRRDVTAKCYGGDVSRKKKLLAKQKEGKKRMKRLGSVDVPVSAFRALVTSGGGGGVGGK